MALIKESPMLFSTDMVKAILDGRKTMTRRTKGITTIEKVNGMKTMTSPLTGRTHTYVDAAFKTFEIQINSGLIECPYGSVGDILWVRETWAKIHYEGVDEKMAYIYRTDNLEVKRIWKPSIHMPKIAARVWLQITDIRVEPLQSISDSDALLEGVERQQAPEGDVYYFYPCKDLRDDSYINKPATSFTSLWASINGWDSWKSNPFVWVISFKVLSTTGKPAQSILEGHYWAA